ncbi:hypothetical protein ACFLWC_05430 [Chloroflexota bacterium]
MNMILGLIMAAIFISIGVALEPELSTTVATITTPTYSSGVAGLNRAIVPVSSLIVVYLALRSILKPNC